MNSSGYRLFILVLLLRKGGCVRGRLHHNYFPDIIVVRFDIWHPPHYGEKGNW